MTEKDMISSFMERVLTANTIILAAKGTSNTALEKACQNKDCKQPIYFDLHRWIVKTEMDKLTNVLQSNIVKAVELIIEDAF